MAVLVSAAHETVKRRLTGLAELRERGLRYLRFGLASPRRENYAQRVAGNKSLWPCPFLRWLFTSAVRIKITKEKQVAKNQDSVQYAIQNSFCKGKAIIIQN
jgi:hypothetical protein